ncbi:MAG: transporter substrate-binding domain-containing protein, partial [Clostridia bacterium]|nr:transporter substrate-binding domain-containing protein [Clostridia bacterium]
MSIKTKSSAIRFTLFFALLLLLCALPWGAMAEAAPKTVRVGYYEDHNFQAGAGEDLVKSGYSFEYLQRLAVYTGWTYEYVYGDFGTLYDALLEGEVDLLTGLAYKEDRADLISYPKLAMGNTLYSFLKQVGRTDITSDPASLAGKKIAVLAGVMENVVRQYLAEYGVTAELVLFGDMNLRDEALIAGEVDAALVEVSATGVMEGIESFAEAGANDYFACIAKNRPDLLEELDAGQAELFRANPNLKTELYDKWFRHNAQSAALTANDKEWIAAHPEFRLGYYKSYLPYSGQDASGNVTGVVKDIVTELLTQLDITEVTPVYTGFDTTDDLLRALKAGEVDAVFPAFSEYWVAETAGYTPTEPVISTYYNLVYRGSYPDLSTGTLAMRRSNGLVRMFARLKFPTAKIVYYHTLEECLDAVVSGAADATLLSGLRTAGYMLLKTEYQQLRVSQIPGNMALGFGLRRDDHAGLEFFNHGIGLIDADFALTKTYDYQEKIGLSTAEFLRRNPWVLGGPILVVGLMLLVLALREVQQSRKHLREEARHSHALEEKLAEISALNDELTVAKERADSANAAKSKFLFNMSHDIRTPMNAVKGFRDLLERNQEDPEKRRDYLKKIGDANDMLLSIINNVLEMARIESGNVTVDWSVCSVDAFNEKLFSVFDALMRQKDITFTREVDVRHKYVLCDPVKLHEIFANILSNAYKYTPAGGHVSMRVRELPETLADGRILLETTVEDDGIGISEEFLPHIFEEFTREKNTTDAKIEGTGLGMPIVKKLVEML